MALFCFCLVSFNEDEWLTNVLPFSVVVSNIFYFHPDPWGNDPIWRSYFSNGLVQPPTRLPLFCFQTCLALESYQPVEGVFLDGTFGLIAMLGSCSFCRFPKHDAPLSTFTIPDKNMSIYLQKSCPRTTHIYYLRKKKDLTKIHSWNLQLKPWMAW